MHVYEITRTQITDLFNINNGHTNKQPAVMYSLKSICYIDLTFRIFELVFCNFYISYYMKPISLIYNE